jgi:anti-sigma B factor antagonist
MSPSMMILKASGVFDATQGAKLRDDITLAVQTGCQVVLVDLEQVSFIDSAGLSALVAALKVARAAGSKLYLCSLENQVKMLFELTSMNQVFRILPDRLSFLEMIPQ